MAGAIRNCIFWGNSGQAVTATTDVTDCIVQGGLGFGTNITSADPALLPLGNYGGPTKTMPVSIGSYAINHGSAGADTPAIDQRGFARHAMPDIGACEWQENLAFVATRDGADSFVQGERAVLDVVPESVAGSSFQWFTGVIGDTSHPIAGATQSHLVTDPLIAATSFWVMIQSGSNPIEAGINLSVTVPHIIHVTPAGNDAADGSMWQTAMRSIQGALAASRPGDHIWVSGGTYRTSGTQFSLRNNVSVYGGFAGNETRLDQRDIAANPTVLTTDNLGNDADTNGDGAPDSPTTSDNDQSVFVNDAVGPTATLDGFILSGATVTAIANINGSSPTIANCTFRCNPGSSVQNWNSSSPQILNSTFHNNAPGKVVMQNLDTASPTVVNCTFSAKPSQSPAPCVDNESQSSPKILNCTFVENYIYNSYNKTGGTPTIQNCIFWGSLSAGISGTPATVLNCVIRGGYSEGTNIITQDPKLLPIGNYGGPTPTMPVSAGSSAIGQGLSGATVPVLDQRGFIRDTQSDIGACEWQQGVAAVIPEDGTDRYAVGARAVLGVVSEADLSGLSWQWYFGSPGDTSHPVAKATVNRFATPPLMGNSSWWVRGTKTGTTIDAGIGLSVFTPTVMFVRPGGDNARTGRSWDQAKCGVDAALAAAVAGDHIWVAGGVYPTANRAMRTDIALYGGFAGTETRMDQRDIAANPTFLTGDINGDDTDTDSDGIPDTGTGENPTFIFRNTSVASSAVLDGFILTGATSAAVYNSQSSPVIANCEFRGNPGSAVRNYSNGFTVIRNCTFHRNGAAVPVIINSDSCSSALVNCTFGLNGLNGVTPDIYNSGNASIQITNCTFALRSGQRAVSVIAPALLTIKNTIMWGNGNFTSAISGQPAAVSDCVIQRGYPGGTRITTNDPLLMALGNYGGPTPTMPPAAGSPAVNSAATAADVPSLDQRGFLRDGAPDIGACEFGQGIVALVGEAPSSPASMVGTPVSVGVYSDGSAPFYQWYYGASGDTSRPVAGGNGATLQLGPLDLGVKVWARVLPGGGASATDTVERTIEVRGTFDDWCNFHGLNGSERDPKTSVAGDGLCNLLKFALGLPPRSRADQTDKMLSGFDLATKSLAQEWTVSKTPSDLSLAFEYSEDLQSWTSVSPTLIREDEASRTWKVVRPIGSGGKGFLRLRAQK